MTLFPPQDYRKTQSTHRIGTAAQRPAAADVLEGTLYFSTDTLVLQRSNGIIWETYAGSGTAATVAGPSLFVGIDGEDGESIIGPPGPIGPRGPSGGIAFSPYLFDAQADIEPEIATPFGNVLAGGDVWNDVAYDAANFTASAGTWTVDVGDQVTYKYIMLSRTAMCVTFAFNTTSVSTLCQELRFKLPLNKTARTTDILSAIRSYDNGTDTVGFCGVVSGNNYIRNWRSGFSNWAVAVNNTSVQGVVICELNP